MKSWDLLAGVSAVAAFAVALPAVAQTVSISVPSMPMEQALKEIERQSGHHIEYDPDAVKGLTSVAVTGAKDENDAIEKAITGSRLVLIDGNGVPTIISFIVVMAHRDEAETSLLVRDASTSSRSGASLREQARNTTVISSKLMEDQQAQSVTDALRDAGGVIPNFATVQGGTSYSVRGFGSTGLTNGLSSSVGNSSIAGAAQPVAGLERVEILKGPDALLNGSYSLGGTINLVTKKPTADPLLNASVEYGSYQTRKGTIDASDALSDDEKISGRLILSGSDADRNMQNYRGDQNYLVAPSLRYKDEKTDAILSGQIYEQNTGVNPYTYMYKGQIAPVRTQPTGPADTGFNASDKEVTYSVEHKATDWLTVVSRGQYQNQNLSFGLYAPYAVLAPTTLLINNSQNEQRNRTWSLDDYARLKFDTFVINHNINIGYSFVQTHDDALDSSKSSFFPFSLTTGTVKPLPPIDETSYSLDYNEQAFYFQDIMTWGPAHFIGGVRQNWFDSTSHIPGRPASEYSASASVPSYGAVYDITDNLSLFGNYALGFIPNFSLDYTKSRLPDISSKNLEGGVKLSMLNQKLELVASVFRLQQSNVVISDPAHPGYYISTQGQESKGVDLDLRGTILPGWTVVSTFTYSKFDQLTRKLGAYVAGQPRVKYSLYTSYTEPVGEDLKLTVSGGLYGNSSSYVNNSGTEKVPDAKQFDVNVIGAYKSWQLNVGVKNLFDRRNYGVSTVDSYIPVLEPRTWHATLSYKFF
ncbi:putative TonB-dependent siderophore receptor [Nitrospirillum viridazoti Y2]|uniref:Iron complex outermembrane receptor protein n=1 Tax=Nitrospirillum amazonense TaxID=28077 RepID=A0A560INR4_9PROT|nr:TonB-dependent receptor [Nitrospirillum amazonense]EGX99440.1 putative TonB-dependent siderophore receptor [Nitrospirillum amazonense Y2]TWB60618.1 iron complex outermembrane receptor protein [Nitrospirillum amazonense]